MTDQHVPHPTLADMCREIGEIKRILIEMQGRNTPLNPPVNGGKCEGNGGSGQQPAEVRKYIAGILFPKLKKLGIQSKDEAERMLYGFCLIDKFEELTQAQAEAFFIHVQENSTDPPALWKLKKEEEQPPAPLF
jgi:hypothetical protein